MRLVFRSFLQIAVLFTLGCGSKNQDSGDTATDTVQTQDIPAIQVPSAADSAVLEAEKRLQADSSEENFIWYGRRLGYVNKMDEAIATFTAGLLRYPNSYKLYRFRGHRYISIREFSLAVIDLEKAAGLVRGKKTEIEPDGIPNRLNKPLSNYPFNIYYHLGLSYYLIGDFYRAQIAYEQCMKYSGNDDLLVATADWLYMTYRRMNDVNAAQKLLAAVPDQLNIIENDAYAQRIQLYKGKLKPEAVLSVNTTSPDFELNLATQGYGVANWYYYTGEPDKAYGIFKSITEGKSPYSFGFIAAETDLRRLWKKQ